MASNRYSLDTLHLGPVLEENEDSPVQTPKALQKELTHKLHETKRLKDTYHDNWKK